MVDNNETDLDKIYENYLELKKQAVEMEVQLHKQIDELRAMDSKIKELDIYKKQYMVRIYKEFYDDIEVEAFNEKDAVEVALEQQENSKFDWFEHTASSNPRAKMLCLKENYNDDMEGLDD